MDPRAVYKFIPLANDSQKIYRPALLCRRPAINNEARQNGATCQATNHGTVN